MYLKYEELHFYCMLLLLEFIYKLNQFIIALIEITVNK